jgi:hypothetical protein
MRRDVIEPQSLVSTWSQAVFSGHPPHVERNLMRHVVCPWPEGSTGGDASQIGGTTRVQASEVVDLGSEARKSVARLEHLPPQRVELLIQLVTQGAAPEFHLLYLLLRFTQLRCHLSPHFLLLSKYIYVQNMEDRGKRNQKEEARVS